MLSFLFIASGTPREAQRGKGGLTSICFDWPEGASFVYIWLPSSLIYLAWEDPTPG